MTAPRLIGVDFDNTIVSYDAAFVAAAEARGDLPPGAATTKREVRSALRAQADGERAWMALQGDVYAARMGDAVFAPGVERFFAACRARSDVAIVIVSHKTRRGHFDPAGRDLRAAARGWMVERGFFDADGFGLSSDHVFFEDDRDDKVARIGAIGCESFVDDLIEVLRHPGFPSGVRRIHYSDATPGSDDPDIETCDSWDAIHGLLLA